MWNKKVEAHLKIGSLRGTEPLFLFLPPLLEIGEGDTGGEVDKLSKISGDCIEEGVPSLLFIPPSFHIKERGIEH